MLIDRDKAIEACDLARDAWNAALSAQVADLYAQVAKLEAQKELANRALHDKDDWQQRAEAAEAQVAELRKDAERMHRLRKDIIAASIRFQQWDGNGKPPVPTWDLLDATTEEEFNSIIDSAKESRNE